MEGDAFYNIYSYVVHHIVQVTTLVEKPFSDLVLGITSLFLLLCYASLYGVWDRLFLWSMEV